jgi:AraC-like DNA-binding protein
VELEARVFPAADLARPTAEADPVAYAQALRELEQMEVSCDARLLRNRILRLLHQLFISGSGLDGIDRQQVAQLFSMHPRTINRRLRAEGTTFNALLAEARYATARQLLHDTHLQITDIACFLGYSQSASFILAFRRWSGTTPTAWRAMNRSI